MIEGTIRFPKCECLSKHDKEELEFVINQGISKIKESMSSYVDESTEQIYASHHWANYRDTLEHIQKFRTCTDRELYQNTIEQMKKIAEKIPDTPKHGDFKKDCLGKLARPGMTQEDTKMHFKFANEICNNEWSKRKNK